MLRVVIAIAAIPATAHAGQATCSNPGLPVGAAASSDLMPGRLTVNLTTTLLPIRGEEIVDESTGPVLDTSRLVLVETRLAAEYAIRPWLAAGAAFPYRLVDVSVDQTDPVTGAPIANPSMIHLRDERLRGIGDPSVSLHALRELGAYRVHVRAGTSIPLAGTEEDPHLLGSIGQEHQHIQLGTGTWIPFASVEAQRGVGPVTVAAWALAHLSLYDNAKGFRAGDRYSGGATASSGFGLRDWTFSLALEGHAESAETWSGIVYQDEGNAGRFDLMTGGGVAWRPLPNLAAVADARFPVYSHVSGTQLDYGLVLGVGVVATFDLAPRRSWRGLDHAAIADPTAALTPVAGKVTVFDLWATWCAPCRDLDDRLAALARAHPDRIAVRKLDVVDPESAAWRRHLAPGQFELPHVKVYGPDGVLVFERSAPPAELVRAIEALLSGR